jgi:hypothetical protein
MTETTEKTVPCTSCQGPVRVRRPSLSGDHFCKEKECQAIKQRKYHRIRRAEAARRAEEAAQVESRANRERLLDLVDALAHAERVTCEACGRTDALPGYAHPDLEGGGCVELRQHKFPLYTETMGTEIVRRIWPAEGAS